MARIGLEALQDELKHELEQLLRRPVMYGPDPDHTECRFAVLICVLASIIRGISYKEATRSYAKLHEEVRKSLHRDPNAFCFLAQTEPYRDPEPTKEAWDAFVRRARVLCRKLLGVDYYEILR